MSVTTRDIVLGTTALLVFPAVLNLTAVTSSGDGRQLDDPLFHRGDRETPAQTARR